jgi:hypothetical protein
VPSIQAGRLPDENGQQLYFVYLAPNVKSQWDAANGSIGHHGSYQTVVFHGWLPVTETVTYAVVANPVGTPGFNAGLTTFQNQTAVSSHELAEAVTDADVRLTATGVGKGGSSGWYDSDPFNIQWYGTIPIYTPNPNFGKEIGDITANKDGAFTANGRTYTVQQEWSNYYGEGIIANGTVAFMMDVPISPPIFFNYLVHNTWNNGGRSTSYYYGVGIDGRVYENFVTAAGDLGGWFTIN